MQNEPWNQRLRRERIAHNWRQHDLAEQLGTAITTVQYWERGSRQPSAYFRTKLCALFGKSMQELGFGDEITLVETKSEITITKSEQIRLELARHPHLSDPETYDLLDTSPIELPLRWNVPYARNPFFTGRQDLLDTLHNRLRSGKVVALTQSYALSGLGGIGKTQLAVEYSYRHGPSYSAIWWIAAESVETTLNSFVSIAEHLQLSEQQEADQQKIVAAVQRWLSTHSQWLLIWDNVEDLGLLQRFLPATRAGAMLITTRRQALGTLAQAIELPSMTLEEGLLLLLQRAKMLSPEKKLEQLEEIAAKRHTEYQAAQELVVAMDGLPLALDQAGAYIEETRCSVANYLQRFQARRVPMLNRRGEVTNNHPASVVTTWSLSFEQVEQHQPLAGELLRCCAFLHPDAIPEELFTKAATHLGSQLQQIADDPQSFDEAIRLLLSYSLIRRDPSTATLSIHRLVQAVLLDNLPEGVRKQWQERVIQALVTLFPRPMNEALATMARLLPHALICVPWIEQDARPTREATDLLTQTGGYLRERGQYTEAKALLLRALALREQQLGPEHLDTARSLDNLANLYVLQGEYEQAEPLFQRALAISKQQLGPDHPETAQSLNNLAILYAEQGKYEQAEPLFEHALAIHKQQSDSPYYIASSLLNLAELYQLQNKYEQAEPLFQSALTICEQQLEPDHPLTATTLACLATLYRLQGKYGQAEQLYQRSLTICEQQLGLDHLVTANSLANLATLYRLQDKYEQAEPLFRRALAIRERKLVPTHPYLAEVLHEFAILRQEQNQHDEAKSLYERALEARTYTLGAAHPDTIETRSRLTALLREMGRIEEAAALEATTKDYD